jgi:hypothetical protein
MYEYGTLMNTVEIILRRGRGRVIVMEGMNHSEV